MNLQHIVYNTVHSNCSHACFCLQNSASQMAKLSGIYFYSKRGDNHCVRADKLIPTLNRLCVDTYFVVHFK